MSIEAVLSGAQPWHVECGDAVSVLRTMPDESVQCAVPGSAAEGVGSCARVDGVGGLLGPRRAGATQNQDAALDLAIAALKDLRGKRAWADAIDKLVARIEAVRDGEA